MHGGEPDQRRPADIAAAGMALANAQLAEAASAAAVDAARASVDDALEWRAIAELCLSEAPTDDPAEFASAAADYQAAVECVAETSAVYDAACVVQAGLRNDVADARRHLESLAARASHATSVGPAAMQPRWMVTALVALGAFALARVRLRTSST